MLVGECSGAHARSRATHVKREDLLHEQKSSSPHSLVALHPPDSLAAGDARSTAGDPRGDRRVAEGTARRWKRSSRNARCATSPASERFVAAMMRTSTFSGREDPTETISDSWRAR